MSMTSAPPVNGRAMQERRPPARAGERPSRERALLDSDARLRGLTRRQHRTPVRHRHPTRQHPSTRLPRTFCQEQDVRGHASRMVFACGRTVCTLFFVSHFSPSAKNERQKMVSSTLPQAQKMFCSRDRVNPVNNTSYAVIWSDRLFAFGRAVPSSVGTFQRSNDSTLPQANKTLCVSDRVPPVNKCRTYR